MPGLLGLPWISMAFIGILGFYEDIALCVMGFLLSVRRFLLCVLRLSLIAFESNKVNTQTRPNYCAKACSKPCLSHHFVSNQFFQKLASCTSTNSLAEFVFRQFLPHSVSVFQVCKNFRGQHCFVCNAQQLCHSLLGRHDKMALCVD